MMPPPRFVRTMRDLYGDAGTEWVAALPRLLTACAWRWSLSIGPPLADLSYNYVVAATRADGTSVVLKVGFPNPELFSEVAALRHYDGQGCARLLAADPDHGALLLERLTPGVPLFSLADDEQATLIAADVMRQLWRPAPADHPFRSVADWAAGLERLRAHFGGGTGPFPVALVTQAERLFAQLLPTMAAPVVLHGDLHHWNILSAERQPWLALDPKGIVGEPAYEVGAFLRNPFPHLFDRPHPERILARRLDLFSVELGLDRDRLYGWSLAQAVLSAWWSYEDHGRLEPFWLRCAELLAAL